MYLKSHKPINVWALDIETEDWTKIVLYYLTDGVVTYKGNTVEEMVKHYLLVPKHDVIISHNGGRFDFLPLLDGYEGEWKATIASGVINMRADNHALLIDSYRLFVLSLDKWTNSKTKLPFKCTCDQKCGGYCQIKRTMSPDDMRILEEYCFNDCIILLKHYKMHLEKLNADGFSVFNKSGTPRSTIGAVAYNTAKKWCELPEGKIEHGFYKQTKQAYYGGNNNCISAFSDVLYLYDINSAYPAEQLKPLPTGNSEFLTGVTATHAYADNKPGLYFIKAYQDPCNLPCLPRRMKGNGRVVWATGYTEGWYVLREAQLAEEECSFFDVCAAMVWDKEEALYAKYIDTCYKLRQQYKKEGDNYEHVIKILLNSLYGKLAQNTKTSELYYFSNVDDTPDVENQSGGVIWEPIHGTKFWTKTTDNVVPESAKPWQASYITGNVRANLYRFIKPVANDVAYIDTDCIYTRKRITENLDNNKLGFFKFEGTAYNWRSIGPKVYSYETFKGVEKKERKAIKITPEIVEYIVTNFKSVSKAKGLPFISKEKFNDFMDGISVTNNKGVNGVISSLKRQKTAFTRRELVRTNNSDPRLLGTRFITGRETSKPLHYEKGSPFFCWPNQTEKPHDFHPWLKYDVENSSPPTKKKK
jgi:hypothetical protein